MQSTINKTVLQNGLTVISEFVPGVRSVSAGVWVKAGSRCETTRNKGIAHFLEHMVFKGTERFSALKIAHSLEETGGSLNAYTSKEHTVFYAQSLDTQLSKTISVLADLVCRPLLREKDLQHEKAVVLEEIHAVEDTPEDYIFDLFQEKLFPKQSMGFPILGTTKSVQTFDRALLLDFWETFYSAQNMILSVAGNVQHDRLVRLAERRFVFRNVGKACRMVRPSAAVNIHLEIPDAVNQCHICSGVESIPYTSAERYPAIALNAWLGSGMSSRLFQTIREKQGLAYSVYSYVDFFKDTGIFSFYLGTDVRKASKALKILRKELERLTETPLKESVVKKIKSQLKGNILLGLESTQRRMSRIAKNEIYFQRLISLDESIEKIEHINSMFLLETAQKIFIMKNFNTVMMKPNA